MINNSRRNHLLKLLAERGPLTVAQLSEHLQASAPTVRRDLNLLADNKLLTKVHGGAKPLERAQLPVLAGASFQHNIGQHPAAKRAIARRAAALCVNGETVIINGGSTTYRMVEHLRDARLTILTNSIPIMQDLLLNSQNDILVPGGKMYREQRVIVSPFDNDAIQSHYASKMFIGATAVSPMGLLESDPLLVRAEIKLIKQAEKLVLLVDSSKFLSKRAGLIVASLAQVDTLITDSAVAPSTLDMLHDQNIEVIVVEPESEVPAKGFERDG